MIQQAVAAVMQPLQTQLMHLQAEFQAIRTPEEQLMDEDGLSLQGISDTGEVVTRPTKIARSAFPQALSARPLGSQGK